MRGKITTVINNYCYLWGKSMPAKKTVTKEFILEKAFQLVREGGLDCLNVREVAKECNCSTQPVYLSFSGIDEIRDEVIKKAISVYNEYISNEIKSGKYSEYKAVGMGYIRFAKEEKQLFKMLLMRDGPFKNGWGEESFDKATFMIMKNYGLYKEESLKLHAEMWIFVHGIATMFATEYLDWEWDTVSEMVSDAFFGLVGKKGDNK